MGQQVSWPEPRLPVERRATFGIYAPTSTHTRPATCAEVECPHHVHGWATRVVPGSVDESTLLQAASGALDGVRRRYHRPVLVDGWHRYVFPAGQVCLGARRHRKALDRPMIHVVRGGDWRGVVGEPRVMHGEAWLNTFGEHQDRLAGAINGSPQ